MKEHVSSVLTESLSKFKEEISQPKRPESQNQQNKLKRGRKVAGSVEIEEGSLNQASLSSANTSSNLGAEMGSPRPAERASLQKRKNSSKNFFRDKRVLNELTSRIDRTERALKSLSVQFSEQKMAKKLETPKANRSAKDGVLGAEFLEELNIEANLIKEKLKKELLESIEQRFKFLNLALENKFEGLSNGFEKLGKQVEEHDRLIEANYSANQCKTAVFDVVADLDSFKKKSDSDQNKLLEVVDGLVEEVNRLKNHQNHKNGGSWEGGNECYNDEFNENEGSGVEGESGKPENGPKKLQKEVLALQREMKLLRLEMQKQHRILDEEHINRLEEVKNELKILKIGLKPVLNFDQSDPKSANYRANSAPKQQNYASLTTMATSNFKSGQQPFKTRPTPSEDSRRFSQHRRFQSLVAGLPGTGRGKENSIKVANKASEPKNQQRVERLKFTPTTVRSYQIDQNLFKSSEKTLAGKQKFEKKFEKKLKENSAKKSYFTSYINLSRQDQGSEEPWTQQRQLKHTVSCNAFQNSEKTQNQQNLIKSELTRRYDIEDFENMDRGSFEDERSLLIHQNRAHSRKTSKELMRGRRGSSHSSKALDELKQVISVQEAERSKANGFEKAQKVESGVGKADEVNEFFRSEVYVQDCAEVREDDEIDNWGLLPKQGSIGSSCEGYNRFSSKLKNLGILAEGRAKEMASGLPEQHRGMERGNDEENLSAVAKNVPKLVIGAKDPNKRFADFQMNSDAQDHDYEQLGHRMASYSSHSPHKAPERHDSAKNYHKQKITNQVLQRPLKDTKDDHGLPNQPKEPYQYPNQDQESKEHQISREDKNRKNETKTSKKSYTEAGQTSLSLASYLKQQDLLTGARSGGEDPRSVPEITKSNNRMKPTLSTHSHYNPNKFKTYIKGMRTPSSMTPRPQTRTSFRSKNIKLRLNSSKERLAQSPQIQTRPNLTKTANSTNQAKILNLDPKRTLEAHNKTQAGQKAALNHQFFKAYQPKPMPRFTYQNYSSNDSNHSAATVSSSNFFTTFSSSHLQANHLIQPQNRGQHPLVAKLDLSGIEKSSQSDIKVDSRLYDHLQIGNNKDSEVGKNGSQRVLFEQRAVSQADIRSTPTPRVVQNDLKGVSGGSGIESNLGGLGGLGRDSYAYEAPGRWIRGNERSGKRVLLTSSQIEDLVDRVKIAAGASSSMNPGLQMPGFAKGSRRKLKFEEALDNISKTEQLYVDHLSGGRKDSEGIQHSGRRTGTAGRPEEGFYERFRRARTQPRRESPQTNSSAITKDQEGFIGYKDLQSNQNHLITVVGELRETKNLEIDKNSQITHSEMLNTPQLNFEQSQEISEDADSPNKYYSRQIHQTLPDQTLSNQQYSSSEDTDPDNFYGNTNHNQRDEGASIPRQKSYSALIDGFGVMNPIEEKEEEDEEEKRENSKSVASIPQDGNIRPNSSQRDISGGKKKRMSSISTLQNEGVEEDEDNGNETESERYRLVTERRRSTEGEGTLNSAELRRLMSAKVKKTLDFRAEVENQKLSFLKKDARFEDRIEDSEVVGDVRDTRGDQRADFSINIGRKGSKNSIMNSLILNNSGLHPGPENDRYTGPEPIPVEFGTDFTATPHKSSIYVLDEKSSMKFTDSLKQSKTGRNQQKSSLSSRGRPSQSEKGPESTSKKIDFLASNLLKGDPKLTLSSALTCGKDSLTLNIDDNGFLLDKKGYPILDDEEHPIKLTPEHIEFLKENNLYSEEVVN